MPSYSELMAVAGFRSKNAAYKLVQRMVAQEWLEKDADRQTPAGSQLFMTFRSLAQSRLGFPLLPRKS